ncbi:hypothetical protein CDAR_418611 [Caerostris darwini]|uniref:Uncharacterized protein n=1 Tax=Caerostris darwini TaxID=1538125 RepID=A0AAV4MWK3_9ARAC|nr:hypothetical protein CDAR_418611 [Caerostris darwini]
MVNLTHQNNIAENNVVNSVILNSIVNFTDRNDMYPNNGTNSINQNITNSPMINVTNDNVTYNVRTDQLAKVTIPTLSIKAELSGCSVYFSCSTC